MTLEARRSMAAAAADGNVEVTLDEIAGCLSSEEFTEFSRAMAVVQDILDNPSTYVGSRALVEAARLAAIRTKIGARAQYYKVAEKSIIQRRRKDLMLTMFSALEENINTLKLLGRIEARTSGMM
jgi:hypothetical protein